MGDDPVDEAVRHLEETLVEYRQEKQGEAVIAALEQYFKAQSDAAQGALSKALLRWLDSGDLIRADCAIALSAKLGIIENLPAMERALNDVRSGHSRLPDYFVQFLEPAIGDLHELERAARSDERDEP